MSGGGLIASMLGGAATSGLAIANKIGSEKRENEKQQGLLQQRNDREDTLLTNANDRDDQIRGEDREYQSARDTLAHTRNLQLSRQKSKTSGAGKIDPRITQRVSAISSLLKSDSTPAEDRKALTDELNQLTSLNTLPIKPPPSLNDIVDPDAVKNDSKNPPPPVPQYKILEQQEAAAELDANNATVKARDQELAVIGDSLKRTKPFSEGTKPSKVAKELHHVKRIMSDVDNGKRVSRQEIDLLRLYNIPDEIMQNARATY